MNKWLVRAQFALSLATILGRGVPGPDGFHDLQRDPENNIVDLPLLSIGRCTLANAQHRAACRRQDYRHHLVRTQLLAECPPRGVDPPLEKVLLDGDQQVISQHTEEDVGLGTVRKLMEDRTLHQSGLHRSERTFHQGQQHVGSPDLIGAQVLAIRLEDVAAIELLGESLPLCDGAPATLGAAVRGHS